MYIYIYFFFPLALPCLFLLYDCFKPKIDFIKLNVVGNTDPIPSAFDTCSPRHWQFSWTSCAHAN